MQSYLLPDVAISRSHSNRNNALGVRKIKKREKIRVKIKMRI